MSKQRLACNCKILITCLDIEKKTEPKPRLALPQVTRIIILFKLKKITKDKNMRFSYCIFDTFRVPGGRVRLAMSAGASAAHRGQNPDNNEWTKV